MGLFAKDDKNTKLWLSMFGDKEGTELANMRKIECLRNQI